MVIFLFDEEWVAKQLGRKPLNQDNDKNGGLPRGRPASAGQGQTKK
jgi:hypothetical protein